MERIKYNHPTIRYGELCTQLYCCYQKLINIKKNLITPPPYKSTSRNRNVKFPKFLLAFKIIVKYKILKKSKSFGN